MNGFVVFGVAVVLGAPVVMVDDDGWVGEWIDLCWLVMFCSVVCLCASCALCDNQIILFDGNEGGESAAKERSS